MDPFLKLSLYIPLICGVTIFLLLLLINTHSTLSEKIQYKVKYKSLTDIFSKYEIDEYFREKITNIYNDNYMNSNLFNKYQDGTGMSLNKNDKDLYIWILYTDLLFKDIIYYDSFDYFKELLSIKRAEPNFKVKKEYKDDTITKMYKLLLIKKYKNITLKFMLLTYEALKRTYELLRSIDKLEIPEKHKIKEKEYINSKVRDILFLFFDIIELLYEKYNNTKCSDDDFIEDIDFAELNLQNELLKSIKDDIINKKNIFS